MPATASSYSTDSRPRGERTLDVPQLKVCRKESKLRPGEQSYLLTPHPGGVNAEGRRRHG